MQYLAPHSEEGFTTSHGRFVRRLEANAIANQQGQLKKKIPKKKLSQMQWPLTAEDLKQETR